MPYGIPDATWIKLPADDQAAIIAQSKSQPPPAIGAYAPTPSTPLPPTTTQTVAPPTKATPAPPPTLTAQPTTTTTTPTLDLSGDTLVPKGVAVAARPGVTLIPATTAQPPTTATTNPTQPTPATPTPPSPAPQRTLQTLGGAVAGHSQEYVIGTASFPLVGKVVVTQQASATVSWSGGEGQPSVDFNPSTKDLSVSDHGLAFTDPGVLGLLAKNWTHDTVEAEQLILSGKSEFSAHVINAPSFDVSVGSTKRKVTIDNVTLAASITIKDGDPAIELEASTDLIVPAPPRQAISVTYTITTTYRFEGPKVTPAEVEAVLALAVLTATGLTLRAGLLEVEVGAEP